jgi:nucleoside-diphosphate-sugar epimerase
MRQAILDLRRDPSAASSMAAEFAADNQSYLEGRLGRPMESVDLYLAHFLGAGGAEKFLRAHDANPNAAAAAILPAAAGANRSIFYASNGSPRSFAEIRDRFAAKLGGSMPMPSVTRAHGTEPTTMAVLETAPAHRAAGPTPEYARLAYLMLAALGD